MNITKRQKQLIKDIIKLNEKINKKGPKKYNFYEKNLLYIIEEYDFLITYKKGWLNRYD